MEITPRHINVNNICANISIEYGNKICNARTKEWRALSSYEPIMFMEKMMQIAYIKNKI